MSRRIIILASTLLVAILLFPVSALGYENGGDDGNGYGTHDMVLDAAIAMSGESWVVETTALLATDDPDKVFDLELDKPNHHFIPIGSRGAPQATADYYYQAVMAYEAADFESASYSLGILSHYYTDICQPMHTFYEEENDFLHYQYEWGLGDSNRSPADIADWITPRARVDVADVRKLTVDTALDVRETYPSFIAALRADGDYDPANTTVESITQVNLSRAANGLADMIRSIARGEGVSGPGNLSASMKNDYVAPGATGTAYATCTDAAGQPIEGAKISFSWPLPSGTVVDVVVTDGDGVATSQVDLGDEPLGEIVKITVTSTSGGASDVANATFTVADAIDYIMTTLSNYAPKQGTIVTARTVVLNADGRPIPNLPVTFTWEFKTVTRTMEAMTDKWGVAQSSRDIGQASLSYRIRVRGTAPNPGGTTRSSSKSFLPRENPLNLTFNPVSMGGDDRFETAVAISSKAYYATASTIIIANGRNFPDALGGAALAGGYDAPILPCERTYIPSAVANEIKRLGATKAIILGGTSAVSTDVDRALKNLGVTSITRIGGASRYETARMVAQFSIAHSGNSWDGTAFVATGRNFPDALVSSPIAAARRWPIYLSDPGAYPSVLAAQMKADGVKRVILLGGEGTVSADYEEAMQSTIGDAIRLGGRDRYATGLLIAQYGVEHAGLTWDAMAIATGQNFPDALAGGILGSTRGTVILLTPSAYLHSEVEGLIREVRDEMGTVHYLGKTGAVSTAVRDKVASLIE